MPAAALTPTGSHLREGVVTLPAQASDPVRYALYFTPPKGSALARFDTLWFDAARAARPSHPHDLRTRHPEKARRDRTVSPVGLPLNRQAAITAAPAIYGLHVTLKAPFMLATGRTPTHLLHMARRFAQRCRPVQLPHLRLSELDGFLALRTISECPQAAALAASCVRYFDALRAPPSAEEVARRRTHGLTRRQDALLSQWGYPFVFDAWRFHITLTNRLNPACRQEVAHKLAPLVRMVACQALLLDAVAVCVQESPQQRFRTLARFRFASARSRASSPIFGGLCDLSR